MDVNLLFVPVKPLAASQYFDIEKAADRGYAAIGKRGLPTNAAITNTQDVVILIDTHLKSA